MPRITISIVLIGVLFLCTKGTAAKEEGSISAMAYWTNVIMKPIKETDNLYIRVLSRSVEDDSKILDYSLARTPQAKMYFTDGSSYRFTKKMVIFVDDNNRDIMVGKRKGDFYKAEYSNCITRRCEWFRPFLFPKESIWFKSMSDTILNGDPYKVLTHISNHTHSYNDSTGKYDIPFYHKVNYYYNTLTRVVDYICALPMDVKNNKAWKDEYWLDYDFSMRDSIYNDIFNIEDEKYSQYSFHDDSAPPYSKTIYHTGVAEISDSLLQYPLIDMHGDTTTLSDFEGWVLLDFWAFGCKSCYQWLQTIDRDRKTPQGFVLDAEGIQVVSINPLSDNIVIINELTKRFNAEGYTYSAKGISTMLEMRILPTYYLLSPDKQIVYKSNFLGDYSELLEAKKHFWKQSRLK